MWAAGTAPWRMVIARIEQLGPMEVYDIQTESGEYLSGGLRVHNCFILAVDDTMDSILEWYKEEGLIFKGGSGSGVNLSRIRSSKELLTSGGTASGPVSFMRGADASAGTIKSGGATRRAAKMVVLDVDHPDVEEFIETKAREEEKIRVLRDAGYDMDLGGKDIASVQYQNANNSVRVSDEFMRAVEDGGSFGLAARMTGEIVETVDAKGLFRKMAQAAWECADPGIQYDDTINNWHTCPETGRITASNPCFPADQRVVTDSGLVPIGDLVRRACDEVSFAVYTNDVTAKQDPQDRITATSPTRYMMTGRNEIVELRFSDGSRLRCTPNHRVWTANRGWVHACELTDEDRVVRSFQHAPRPMADPHLPAEALVMASFERSRKPLELPVKWDPGTRSLPGLGRRRRMHRQPRQRRRHRLRLGRRQRGRPAAPPRPAHADHRFREQAKRAGQRHAATAGHPARLRRVPARAGRLGRPGGGEDGPRRCLRGSRGCAGRLPPGPVRRGWLRRGSAGNATRAMSAWAAGPRNSSSVSRNCLPHSGSPAASTRPA